MTITPVLADNYKQFRLWIFCREYNLREYRFIDREYRLHGLDRNTPIILIGNYERNPAYALARDRFHNITVDNTW